MKKKTIIIMLIAIMLALNSCVVEETVKAVDETTAPPETESTFGSSLDGEDEAIAEETEASQDEETFDEYVALEDRIVGIYQSDETAIEYLATVCNSMFECIPSDINKYILMTPTRIAFEEDWIRELGSDEKEDIQQTYIKISNDVEKIDAYYMLSQYNGELDDLFYRFDHHWTQLGAYYAAEAFFQAAGISYHKLSEYDLIEGEAWLGYLYAKSLDEAYTDIPDMPIFYRLPDTVRNVTVYNSDDPEQEPTVNESILLDTEELGYWAFLGSENYAYAIIEGDQTCEQSILVIGDSYMTAFSTWLADNFKTVILIDPRFYGDGNDGIDSLIAEYEVTDFMILVSTSFGSFTEKIAMLSE